MKPILPGALVCAVILGSLAFLAVFVVSVSEDMARHEAPPAWFVAGIYGAGGAVIGFLVGGVFGVVRRYSAQDRCAGPNSPDARQLIYELPFTGVHFYRRSRCPQSGPGDVGRHPGNLDQRLGGLTGDQASGRSLRFLHASLNDEGHKQDWGSRIRAEGVGKELAQIDFVER
jgi:hypothetical protein